MNTAPWVISGEWILDCKKACLDAKLSQIEFDLSHVMVRQNGDISHTHNYSGFSATTVTPGGDDITIEGTIIGTPPIGTNAIKIKLQSVSDIGKFFFELPGNGHLQEELGGVIVESK